MSNTNFSKRLLFLLTLIIFTFGIIAVEPVQAATLTLQNIGVSSVGGRRISSWTYMGTNPVFTGTADPSAIVSISINAVSATATADALGAWSYTPTTLTGEGSFPIVITSGDQIISFTLALSPYSSGTLTGTASGTTKGGVEELPVSGSIAETLKLIGMGMGLIAMGGASWWISREFAKEYSN